MASQTIPAVRDEAGVSLAEGLEALHDKLDRIGAQVAHLYQRTQALEELRDELVPIVKDGLSALSEELAAVEHEFNSEEIAYLLRKLVRATPRLIRALDQLESLQSLGEELAPLGKEILHGGIETLDQLERQGVFRLARGGVLLAERIAAHYTEEDIRLLSDNIVTILDTVKSMTQPDILAVANEALGALHEAPANTRRIGLFGLLRRMRDPEVQSGMALLLELVRRLARGQKTATSSPTPTERSETP